MSESGKNRRDRAAAARDAANAQEKRRERIVRIVGAVTVVVVVVGIIGVALLARSQSGDSSASPTSTASADPNAPLPTGALPIDDEYAFGVPYGTGTDAVPVLAIWEDFQCPACGAVEQANGAGIEKLAEDGKVRLVWRPTTFLDANLATDHSARAVSAWGCAVDAGKAKEFHNLVFANQPEVEGDGWTDEQLIALGEQAGISGAGLETFTTCVTDRTYLGWGANSTAIFYASGVGGTPSATLNGVDIPTEVLVDQATLEALVAEATTAMAGGSPSPSPSAS
ncbi:MAG: thioredoxin domain-containing protein [Actinomycetota bacterium]|nr:thioredoxin domain-containing protein [Actinomycetota bacterium]